MSKDKAAKGNIVSDDFEKRQTVLSVGGEYRVLRDAPSFPDQLGFKAGEILRLNALGYSRYDGAWAYEFRAIDGALKTYWLHDTHHIEELTGTFSS